MEIIKVEETQLEEVVKKAGLQLQDGEETKQSYQPFLVQLAEIQAQANKIDFENPTLLDEEIAGKLRKATVKIRTGSKELKDERKKGYLLRGNLEQACYNLIEASCKLTEETFAKVEKAREIAEKNRKEALSVERLEILTPLCDNANMFPLSEMTDESFTELVNGFKLAAEKKAQDEAKAETERIEAKRKEKAYNDRLIEIAKYQQFHDLNHDYFTNIKPLDLDTSTEEYANLIFILEKIKNEYEIEQERIKAENKRLKAETEILAKQKAESEAELKKEREEKEKIEAELKVKAENDAKESAFIAAEQKAKELADKKAANISDAEKLSVWVKSIKPTYDIQGNLSEVGEAVYQNICKKIIGLQHWAETEIKNKI